MRAHVGVKLVLRVHTASSVINARLGTTRAAAHTTSAAPQLRQAHRAVFTGKRLQRGCKQRSVSLTERSPVGHAAQLDPADDGLHFQHTPIGAKALMQPPEPRRMLPYLTGFVIQAQIIEDAQTA